MNIADRILDINITVDDSAIVVVDNTVSHLSGEMYNSYVSNYVTIEFLTYQDGEHELLVADSVAANELGEDSFMTSVYRYEFNKDGKYYYAKMSIPKIAHFLGKNCSNMVGEIFFKENELFQIVSIPTASDSEHIIAASKSVDILDAYEAIVAGASASHEADESYYFPKKSIFTICNIRKCLVYLQRKMLMGKCSFDPCTTSSELRNTRDFLLSAIYVIDYLKATENFEEAQRIVDNLSNCGFPCEDKIVNSNNCGCGHTI